MSFLRDEIIRILAYRCEDTAKRWAKDYRSPKPNMTAEEELPAVNHYFFQLLTKLPSSVDRELGCLQGNAGSVKNWLNDFANVVAARIVAERTKLYPTGKPAKNRLSSLETLLGDFQQSSKNLDDVLHSRSYDSSELPSEREEGKD